LKQIPSRNRKIPNFSGYKAASSTRNPGNFTEIIDPKQGDFACQHGEKSAVLAIFSVQIARFSRESGFSGGKSGKPMPWPWLRPAGVFALRQGPPHLPGVRLARSDGFLGLADGPLLKVGSLSLPFVAPFLRR
jgi:hypothetical protein